MSDRIFKVLEHGGGVDITPYVQVAYDTAVGSLDWGSGFLDGEEMEALVALAVVMGWGLPNLTGAHGATVARKFPDHYEVLGNGRIEAKRMTA